MARLRPPRSLLPLVALLLAPTGASAQSALAVELGAGAAVPLGSSLQSLARIERDAGTDGSSAGTPLLVDAANDTGIAVHAGVSIDRLDLTWRWRWLPWSDATVRCTGTPPVEPSADGRIDDAAVSWTCGADRRISLRDAAEPPLQTHALGGAWRLRWEPTEWLPLWLAPGASVLLASYRADERDAGLRVGASLDARAGVDIPLDRAIGLWFDTAWSWSFWSTGPSTQRAAGRASATERDVFGAILHDFPSVSIQAGVRFRIE